MPLKKAVFLSESLPPIASDTKYFARYRITSDDDTLKSQWSGIYELEGNTIQDFLGTAEVADTLSATVSPDQRYILLQWESIGGSVLGSSVFDVFAQWSTSTIPSWSVDNYEYVATISSNNFSILIPTGASYGKFVVQITTHNNIVSAATIQSLGLGEVVSDTIYDAPDFDGGVI
jgi:hypothetical protein